MDAKNWSTPNYESWKRGIKEVAELPTRKFYFFVTVAAVATIAYFLIEGGEHIYGFSLAVLLLVFGMTAFLMQGRKSGNDRSDEDEDEEIKSPPQPSRGGAVEIARRENGRPQHDRSGVEGTSRL